MVGNKTAGKTVPPSDFGVLKFLHKRLCLYGKERGREAKEADRASASCRCRFCFDGRTVGDDDGELRLQQRATGGREGRTQVRLCYKGEVVMVNLVVLSSEIFRISMKSLSIPPSGESWEVVLFFSAVLQVGECVFI
ncbi:hypothetical protein L1887_25436 [Cichorium endivia]|nr:hypothetical protein L1887_25436 [Cichorium endivia]